MSIPSTIEQWTVSYGALLRWRTSENIRQLSTIECRRTHCVKAYKLYIIKQVKRRLFNAIECVSHSSGPPPGEVLPENASEKWVGSDGDETMMGAANKLAKSTFNWSNFCLTELFRKLLEHCISRISLGRTRYSYRFISLSREHLEKIVWSSWTN